MFVALGYFKPRSNISWLRLGYEISLRVELCKGFQAGRFHPCSQILDLGGSDWK